MNNGRCARARLELGVYLLGAMEPGFAGDLRAMVNGQPGSYVIWVIGQLHVNGDMR